MIKITTTDALTGHSRDYVFSGGDAVLSWAEEQTSGIDLPERDAASVIVAALESFRSVSASFDGTATSDLREVAKQVSEHISKK